MKRLIFFFSIFLFLSENIMPQGLWKYIELKNGKKVKWEIYMPSGEKYNGKAKTFKEFYEHLGNGNKNYIYSYYYHNDSVLFTIVIFKALTDSALYIATTDSSFIQKAIKSFDLNEYFNSYSFELKIKEMIKNKSLTDYYLLISLGHPLHKSLYYTNGKSLEYWDYKYPNITFIIQNGIVTGYSISN